MPRILLLSIAAASLFLLPGSPGGLADESAPPAGPSAGEKGDRGPDAAGATPQVEAKQAEKTYPAQDPTLGAIEGRVTLEGDPPVQKPLEIPANNKDHAACAAHFKDLRLIISSAKEVANAVVSVAGYKPPKSVAPREISVDNKHCTFLPRIQATTVGSKLKITSSDPFLHNTHGLFSASFNKAVARGDEIIQKLPKQGPVLLQCDFHPWMQAWIQVFSHDLFDVSDPKGTFRLVNVPPGEHEIEIWHEFLEGPKQKVKVEAGKTVTLDLKLRARPQKKSSS